MNVTTHNTSTSTQSSTKNTKGASTAARQQEQQQHKHKHKHKRNGNGRNEEHEEQRKQAAILPAIIVCYNAILSQTITAGTNEGTNEENKLSFFQRLKRQGKGRTDPGLTAGNTHPRFTVTASNFSGRLRLATPFNPPISLSHLLLPSHLFCPYSTARFSSSCQTVQYVLCFRSHPVHYWSSAGSALQQVKSNWEPGGGGVFHSGWGN